MENITIEQAPAWMSVVIASLSVLTATLVGMQIYQTINLDRFRRTLNKEFKRKFDDYHHHVESINHLSKVTLSIHTHLIIKTISLATNRQLSPRSIHDSLKYIAKSLDEENKSSNKSNITAIYSELDRIIECLKSDIETLTIEKKSIELIIQAVMQDNTNMVDRPTKINDLMQLKDKCKH